MQTVTQTSRAVVRTIEPGNFAHCRQCGGQVKFQARSQARQVICNVYDDGRWQRVEHFHAICYGEAGQPYGPASVD